MEAGVRVWCHKKKRENFFLRCVIRRRRDSVLKIERRFTMMARPGDLACSHKVLKSQKVRAAFIEL